MSLESNKRAYEIMKTLDRNRAKFVVTYFDYNFRSFYSEGLFEFELNEVYNNMDMSKLGVDTIDLLDVFCGYKK